MNLTLSITMLAAVALFAGAGFLWIAKNERKKAGLMALLALIMIANIAIWTVPSASGEAPLDQLSD